MTQTAHPDSLLSDLMLTRARWQMAVHAENREAEQVCMARLDTLLDRLGRIEPPRPKPSHL